MWHRMEAWRTVTYRGQFPELKNHLWWCASEFLQINSYMDGIPEESARQTDFDCELKISSNSLETSLMTLRAATCLMNCWAL
ncbi:hypothetical protein CEXT_494431, partial [Caerostris extrusa]